MSAIGLKITNFHYANTTFTKPEGFIEFPKYVYPEGKPPVIVQNAEEEAAVMSNRGDEVLAPRPVVEAIAPPSTITLTGSNDEREILLQIAAEKNIKVNKRWNLARLRATIERETADQ